MCFGLPQGHIYPCHMGCIVNSMDKRETDETGDVQVTPLSATQIYVTCLSMSFKLDVILTNSYSTCSYVS